MAKKNQNNSNLSEEYEDDKLWWQRKLSDIKFRQKKSTQVEFNFRQQQSEIDGTAKCEGPCPCGSNHRGVRFYKNNKPISEVLCPNLIFTRKLRAEIREGRGVQFAETYDAFMEVYAGVLH